MIVTGPKPGGARGAFASPTGPKGPHFGSQGPTFRVLSFTVNDTYIDHILSLWDSKKQEINLFVEQANSFHPKIKFTAEISENETELHFSSLPFVMGKD